MDLPTLEELTQRKKKTSERADLIGQLYDLYSSEKNLRRKENWKRYCHYCREIKNIPPEKFRTVRGPHHLKFISELTVRDVAVKLGHLKKNEDLYYLLSVCKDKRNRGESVSKYLIGAT